MANAFPDYSFHCVPNSTVCIYLQCPLTLNLTYDQIFCDFQKLIFLTTLWQPPDDYQMTACQLSDNCPTITWQLDEFPLLCNEWQFEISCIEWLTKIKVFVLASLYFNLRCQIIDSCQMKWFLHSVHIEFPSELKQKTFIHGEISIRTKLGFHFHRHQKSQSLLLLGSQKVGPCNTLPKI